MALASTGSVVQDVHCDTIDEVFEEIRRRKSSPGAEAAVTRFEESPYGGYRVYSVDAETLVDELANPVQPQLPPSGFAARRTAYR